MNSPFKSLIDSFSRLSRNSRYSRLAEDESMENSHSVTVVNNILASDPLVHDPLKPSLFSTPVSKTISSTNSSSSPSLFSTQPSPISSIIETSQPIPTTQTFINRLSDLRNVENLTAQSPILALKRQSIDNGDREREGILFSAAATATAASLERENGDLKSEVAALRLRLQPPSLPSADLSCRPKQRQQQQDEPFSAIMRQIEELRSEIAALRLQHEEDQQVIAHLRQNPPQQHPLTHQHPLQQQPQPGISTPTETDGLIPYISKSKKKKMKKMERERMAAETTMPPGCEPNPFALPPLRPPPSTSRPLTSLPTTRMTAETTLPPGCEHNVLSPLNPTSRPPNPTSRPANPTSRPANPTSRPANPTPATTPVATSPAAATQPQHLPTLFLYHDSNLKNVTAAEIKKYISQINYIINPQETFTLSQTLDKIKQTNYGRNDLVIINTLTNDARNTKNRQRRSPDNTRQLQTQIIDHLLSFIPRQNITFLESPPLLDSPDSDIFAYNIGSYQIARKFGINFAQTLIGEQHVWTDGYHILKNKRPLLVKSVAAAALKVNPHQHFGLRRPPFGDFGPWPTPNGQGAFRPEYRQAAMSLPMNFRRPRSILPLMGINIRRPQRS